MSKKKVILTSIIVMVIMMLSIGVKVSLYEPSKINAEIASKVFKTPANTAFKDDNFYKCVVDAYNDKNGTSVAYTTKLTDEQLLTITDLICDGYRTSLEEKIENTQGIEKMSNITQLNLSNNNIKSINLNNLIKLSYLNLSDYSNIEGDNEISTIDLSKNTNLSQINLGGLGLNELNLTTLTNLFFADLSNNNLANIDLSNNNEIKSLDISNNNFELLNVSNLVNLSILDVSNNQLNNLNVTKNVKLTDLSIGDSGKSYNGGDVLYNSTGNNITSIDLKQNTLLTNLDISANPITNLDVSGNTKIKFFAAVDSLVTNIDFSKMLDLTVLDLSNIPLNEIDLSLNKNIVNLYIINTYITKLNLPSLSKLTQANILNNKYMTEFSIETLSLLSYLKLSNNALSKLNIPSSNALDFLDLSNNNLTDCNFKFSNLTKLYVRDNKCSSLNISNLPNIGYVNAENNLISKFVYSESNTNNLKYLNLENNKLRTIDLSKFVNINGYSSMPLLLAQNNFGEEAKAVYVNETLKVNDMVILPSYLRYSQTDWTSSNNNIATVDSGGLVTTISPGQVNIVGTGHVSQKMNTYTTTSSVYVIKALSDKYVINEEAGYIYTKTDTNPEIILKNINLNYGEAVIEDNKLLIKYESEIIKQFKILNISSDKYNLTKDYIFGYEENSITINNGIINKNTNNNILEIKYGEYILETYKLVEAKSDKYDLTKTFININIKDNTINEFLENIDCINCEVKVYDGINYITEGNFDDSDYTLRIMYGEDVIKEYSLFFAVSGVILNEESVKLGVDRRNIVQLEATINPNKAINKKVSWASSNEDVAIVDNNGLVTSKGVGTTTITVTTEDGGYTDTVNVTVVDIILYNLIYKDGDTTYISQYEDGESVTLKSDLTKTGYTLAGYTYNGNTYKLTDKLTMPANDITLTAIWTANNYTLSYDSTAGTKVVTYDSGYGELPLPSKTGYTFKGWYLENTYNTLITSTTKVTTTNNHKLYAKWEVNSYKLTLDLNGGTITGDTIMSVKYNQTKQILNPTRKGYKFKNWSLTGTESKLVNSSFTMGISDSVLKANWELIKPDITKTSDYKVKNGMVSNVKLKAEIKDLNLGLESYYKVKVQDKNKKDKTTGKMATNDKVQIYLDNTLVDEYTVVIKGDVTGTGEASVSDVAKLYQALKGKITMEDCYKEAGNVVDTDSEIKINDIAKLYQFIKGKIKTLD